ncbi:MAG: ABC-2 type transporter [Firmicutes bacterium ADurb.Bin182]|nr:MAG: ABC-2 type transporter [Firmicutes bacterium ADurb.Bin182]
MKGLTRRNLLMFFRDRSNVFFSMLAVIIVFMLYILFLGDMYAGNFQGEGVRSMMNYWLMAGLITVTTVTSTLGAFSLIPYDRETKRIKDFNSSPLSGAEISAAYIISALVIGVIMSLIALICAQAYILLQGGVLMRLETLAKTLGLIVLSVISGSAMVYLMAALFKSRNAFGTAFSVTSTLLGFLTGIYIPIGYLPKAVQGFIKVFPSAHAAALMRQVLMEDSMAKVFAGAPAAIIEENSQVLGVMFKIGDQTVSPLASVLILLGSSLLFFALAIAIMSGKRRD